MVKTYTWEQALKEAVANKTLPFKQYAYVSLFGIKDSSDILQSIFATSENPDPSANEKALAPALGGYKLRELELGKKLKSMLGFAAEHANVPHIAGLGGVARAILLRIPTQFGQGFRFEVGHRSDLIRATIPN